MPLYKANPNNSPPSVNQQVPLIVTGSGKQRFSYAEAAPSKIVTKRPSHVVMNGPGTYAFLYATSCSFGGEAYGSGTTKDGINYVTASIVADGASVRLEVNPVAWTRCDAADAVGQVTFVYVRQR